MSRGVNKVILVGNLGKDPEVKYMPSGDAVCNFSLATSESWKDKTSGDQVEKTEWHNIVLFRKVAEVAGQYLQKGSQVYIEGKLRTRKWQDKSGADRYTTEVHGDNMQMLGSRTPGMSEPAARQNPVPAARRQSPAENSPADYDDDIPF